ncbi:MAG TPA: hypothetical protein VMT20_03790 [Terriglobia bacterium]|nr:hypothetical protein [Terriglobia bacterium]
MAIDQLCDRGERTGALRAQIGGIQFGQRASALGTLAVWALYVQVDGRFRKPAQPNPDFLYFLW